MDLDLDGLFPEVQLESEPLHPNMVEADVIAEEERAEAAARERAAARIALVPGGSLG